jgi:uncharacterized protein (DUF1697 family)
MNFICFLKGINVGENNKIPMADLRTALEDNGFTQVLTYIQSGNLLFSYPGTQSADIENKISSIIKVHFGLQIPVIVLSQKDYLQETTKHKFENLELEPKFLHIIFLSKEINNNLDFLSGKITTEKINIIGRMVHLAYPEGSRNSKITITHFEKEHNCIASSRNWNTIQKMRTLIESNF